jgi:signal transduction histidine kinase
MRSLLRQISALPFAALHLSTSKRLLVVTLMYALAIPGLWYVFPLFHSAVSLVLPIIVTCWLFRYRGLLINIPFILLTLWLTYLFLFDDAVVAGQTFPERAVAGFGFALSFGLVTCWLRRAVDLMLLARERALAAEQERLQQRRFNEIKDHFLQQVSHELLTPLTVLTGSLDLLEAHHERMDGPALAELLHMARTSQEELVGLVKQVLDTTHVISEIPLVQSELTDLQELVHKELSALSQEERKSYTIHVKVPETMMVWTDPTLLRQVLRQLLSNVFKYVPKQTEVTIAATQADPSSQVYLWVQDAGPGIPAQERTQLFEKFGRLKRDQVGTTRGTGLGLYLSKRLVEAMGGRIWVESSGQPGEGSCFCVALPTSSP